MTVPAFVAVALVVPLAAAGAFVPVEAAVRVAPEARAGEAWEEGVQSLLDRRADAVLAHDREAFMETVDPRAAPTFREAQALLFDGLTTVPFDSYELELRTEDVYDLSFGAGGADADEVRLPAVEERFRIAGIDGVDDVSDLWLTFVRRASGWFVNADRDVSDLGLLTQRHLWDFGPVAFTGGDEVVVVSDPGHTERAQGLLAISEEALGRLRSTIEWEGPPKVLIVLPRSTDELEELLQTNFDLTNFVAFAAADVDRSVDVGGWKWTAPRVYAQESNLAAHSREFQVETLHHELVHVVAFDKAGPHVPNWVHEGHADFLALGRPNPAPVSGTDGRLPLDHEFITGDRTSILRSYRESTSAASYLAQRVDETAPSRLLERIGRIRVAPGNWRYHVDQAMQDVYDTTLAEFEEEWNAGR